MICTKVGLKPSQGLRSSLFLAFVVGLFQVSCNRNRAGISNIQEVGGQAEIDSYLKTKRNYFSLDWDQESQEQGYNFLNLSAQEFSDRGAAIGLEYVVAGAQFNYRVPLKIFESVPKPNFNLVDVGSLPSPYGIHRAYGMTLANGFFDETVVIQMPERNKTKQFTGIFTNGNCFGCHAGRVGNTIVGGMYNKDVDLSFGSEQSKMLNRLSWAPQLLTGLSDEETQMGLQLNELNKNMFGPILGGGRRVGDNQGQYISVASVLFLQPGTTDPENFVPMAPNPLFKNHFDCNGCVLPPVQSMPWWLIKYKSKHYYFGESETTDPARQAQDFVLNFAIPKHGYTMPDSSWEKRVERQTWIMRYVNATTSPTHPNVTNNSINKKLAMHGRVIFHGEKPSDGGKVLGCASCHGRYTPSGLGYLVEFRDGKYDVGTDNAYHAKLVSLAQFNENAQRLVDKNGRGPSNYSVPSDPQPSYSAPPLDGVWASAPYFHNGSVPTIRSLLLPNTRPETWSRTGGSGVYDFGEYFSDAKGQVNGSLGLVTSLEPGTYLPSDRRDRLTFRTLESGYSAKGHELQVEGVQDTDADALIEFFKCLGGPNMKAARQGNTAEAVANGHPCEEALN